jgi:hypothetical protein
MRWLLALVFLAGVAFAQSQEPRTQPSQQNAAQQDRGTEKSPVVVKVLKAEQSKSELEREKAKEESESQLVKLTGDLARYTKFLFVATVLLGLATGGLVVVGFLQVRDAKKSIAAAVKSASAAEKAATAAESQTAITAAQTDVLKKQHAVGRLEFFATHRPEIIIHAIEFKRVNGPDEYDRIGISFLCFNIGPVAAENVEVRGEILATVKPAG